jgi:hypothetical protein
MLSLATGGQFNRPGARGNETAERRDFGAEKLKAGHRVRPFLTHTLENSSTPLPTAYNKSGNRHVTSVGDKRLKMGMVGLMRI